MMKGTTEKHRTTKKGLAAGIRGVGIILILISTLIIIITLIIITILLILILIILIILILIILILIITLIGDKSLAVKVFPPAKYHIALEHVIYTTTSKFKQTGIILIDGDKSLLSLLYIYTHIHIGVSIHIYIQAI